MMLSQLTLLALVAGDPVFITSAKAIRGPAGEFSVEVAGESALDAAGVRADLSSGSRLFLYFKGTRVRRDNRAWGEGSSLIRAHRHASHIELDVPLPSKDGCRGPTKITLGPEGTVRATLTCPPQAVASALVADPPSVTPARPVSPKPPKTAPPAAPEEPPPTDAETARLLAGAVALPAQPSAPVPAPKPAAPPPRAAQPQTVPAPARAMPSPSATPSLSPSPPSIKPDASSSWRVVVVPVVALLLLAGASLVLGRRRKRTNRVVTIVETASLGPKRALIVARVGGETLVLGSSEAGITLLRSQGGGSIFAAQAVDGGGDSAPPASSEVLDRAAIDESNEESPGQVRFLARLFGRKEKEMMPGEVEPWNFDGLLEDSIEDQELRRKLSAGFEARVR